MLDVDDILPWPVRPLVLPPPVPEHVYEMQTPALFTMDQASRQQVCRFGKFYSFESTAFTRYFFLLIGRITIVQCERQKIINSTDATTVFVTRTLATGTTAGAAASALLHFSAPAATVGATATPPTNT